MLSIPHLVVIFVVALVVFGPEKLPELARNLGKIMAEFRRHTNDLRSTFEGHLRDLEREAEARKIGGSVTTLPSPQSISIEPAPPSPGTVPSNSPNAAAIAGPPPAEEITSPGVRRHPGDDPYLLATEFAPEISAHTPQPSESEKTPERVTDGDGRPL